MDSVPGDSERMLQDASRYRLTRRLGPVLLGLVAFHPFVLELVWHELAVTLLSWGGFPWIPLTLAIVILGVGILIEVLVESGRDDATPTDCAIGWDSGGLRLSRPGTDAYVPFDVIASCLLIDGGDDIATFRRRDVPHATLAWEDRARMIAAYPRNVVLVAHDAQGRVLGWAPFRRRVAPDAPLLGARAAIERRLAGPRDDSLACLRLLTRQGSGLASWLQRTERLLGSAGTHPYRLGMPTHDGVVSLAGDENATVEQRAAAMHALVSQGRTADAAPMLDECAPPLVVAAAYVAGCNTRATRVLLARAMPFLSEEDQACLEEIACE